MPEVRGVRTTDIAGDKPTCMKVDIECDCGERVELTFLPLNTLETCPGCGARLVCRIAVDDITT